MITVKHETGFCPDPYLISRGIDPDKAVFFDIETTGLKAEYSHLYLIGAAHRLSSGRWQITQWLAEKPQEEAALLRTFNAYVLPFTTLIHFNGNRFDIPYLLEKENKYGLDPVIGQMASEDLYLQLRPLRKMLRMAHMNQKSLEAFMGIRRRDPYDGGQLIGIYRSWIKEGGEERLEAVLLHNREDVEGMLLVSGMYAYLPLADPSLFTPAPEWTGSLTDEQLVLRLALPHALPAPLTLGSGKMSAVLSAKEREAVLSVRVLKGELRYFFPDWKEYYYLPLEDQAIHKSVAMSVSSSYREKARPSTCYVRREGRFLPQTEKMWEPAFKKTYEDSLFYFEADPELAGDPVFAASYARMMITALSKQAQDPV